MSQCNEKENMKVMYLVNKEGECQAVQLSLPLWAKVENQVMAILKKQEGDDDPFCKAQPMQALADLKKYWDFTYPYDAHVHCDACGASTEDWEEDPLHPFHLLNANIGGLLVFRCRCGASVRKKNFHKKIVFECSKPL